MRDGLYPQNRRSRPRRRRSAAIPLTARVLAVFGAPAPPDTLLCAAPPPRLCARFRGLGCFGLCACLHLLRCFRLLGRFRYCACPLFLDLCIARTQFRGLISLEWAALYANLFLGNRSARALRVSPAARLYLRGIAIAGAWTELAPRHRSRLGGAVRLVRRGVVALPRCAPRPDAASLFFLGEGDVRYRGVQLLDPEPRHTLDAVRDPAPHLLDGLEDVLVVFDPHLEVYGCLRPSDLHGDPAGLALRTREAPQYPAGGPRGASAHVDALHLLRRHAGYRGDYSVTDCRGPAIAQERAFTTLLP